MVMTIHKLTAGDGYTYLTRQVAGGDVERAPGQSAADYYTAQGNPPGHWIGDGAALLELSGEQVTETQMRNLFGEGLHPDAERLIAELLATRVTAATTPEQLNALVQQARSHAALGRPFPTYEPLAPFDQRVAARLAVIQNEAGRTPHAAEVKKVHREEARRQRAAVAGFDVVFSPVKSAALLWALDQRAWVRNGVQAAHEEARDAAFALLEKHAALTRAGAGGVAQVETRGLIAAAFDHFDSRAGDPNLHTHVAISNKVQGVDGRWRSLDARALYRMTVAASEYYNTAFETALTRQLGVTFAPRPDTPDGKEPVREVVGMPLEFIDHFSARRNAIEARYDQLIRAYRREHGHDPSSAACHKLARQANLDTRDGKKAARSLQQMRTDWAASLTEAFGPDAQHRIASAVPGPTKTPSRSADIDIAKTAASVVAAVAELRSTWTVWNIHAEAERHVRQNTVFASRDEHHQVVEQIVAEAVGPHLSLRIDAPSLLDEPPQLRRSDGTSVFHEHATARFTSGLILDAEQRLLDAAHTPVGSTLDRRIATVLLDLFEQNATRRLDAGQRGLVVEFASDDRLLAVGLGPAGSGKTTAMRALSAVLDHAGSRLIPLGTSAASAAVLGADLGVQAENLHKFIWEHTVGQHAGDLRHGPPIPGGKEAFRLRPGDVVLVDEAGLAGTLNLDRLVTIAQRHGAVVRLLGDHRQLSAVESGGALRLLATEVGAIELTTLYRFNDPAEAAATLHLRDGDTNGLDFYQSRERIHGGSREAMVEAAYQAWKSDMLAGRTTLMSAATNADVTGLSAQARADRVEASQVEAAGVMLHDGNLAGAGDWIITRTNDRRLSVHHGRDFVKNGDGWNVLHRHDDGSLDVEHLTHRGRIRIPADYVRTSVELLYATTSMRSQGTTVDTAHALITDNMTRENLYVTASRAQAETHLYVVTHELLPMDPDHRLDRTENDPRTYLAREVLDRVLTSEGTELSATETIRTEQKDAGSLATLIPRHEYAATLATEQVHRGILSDLLGPDSALTLYQDPSWRALTNALRQALHSGHQPEAVLADAVRTAARTNESQSAKQLAEGVDLAAQNRPVSRTLSQQATAPHLEWVTSADHLPACADKHLRGYLRESAELINARVRQLAQDATTHPPVWTAALPPAPTDSAALGRWQRDIATIAAYRELHGISTTSPTDPLGPHIEKSRPEHTAYNQATQALARLQASASYTATAGEPSIAERRRAGRAAERQARQRGQRTPSPQAVRQGQTTRTTEQPRVGGQTAAATPRPPEPGIAGPTPRR